MFENAELHNQNPQMNTKELTIWSILSLRKGRALAIKSSDLELRTGIKDREIRNVIKSLIELYGKPIGSTTKEPFGYYVIVDKSEMKEVQKSLRNRAISTLKRAQAYDNSPIRREWVASVIGQLSLFNEGENDAG